MSKLSNCLLMLKYLENGRKYSIKELSEKLEVTERMIRIYKEELEKAGIYIDTIYGPYGGYVLNNYIKLPKVTFNREDYIYLSKINKKDERINEIIDKIKLLSTDTIDNNIELKDEIKTYYNILTKAIKQKRKVKVNYNSNTSKNIDRIIRPIGMFLYNSEWSCTAFCELRNDLRQFVLKDINSIELLDEYYE